MEPSHIDWHLERHLLSYYKRISSVLTNWHRGMAIVFAEDPENTPKVVRPPGASSAYILEIFWYSMTRLQRNGITFAQYSTTYRPPWLRYPRSKFLPRLLPRLHLASTAQPLKTTSVPRVMNSDMYYLLGILDGFTKCSSLIVTMSFLSRKIKITNISSS